MKLIEDFNDLPSLEFLTASQLVSSIWNLPDVVHDTIISVEIENEQESDRMWQGIEHNVSNILENLERFPGGLVLHLKSMVIPIGLQIKAMRKFLNLSPYFQRSFKEFPVNHWTPYGTVDIKDFDKILVQDNRLDIAFRYQIACIDCFEDEIINIFPLLSEAQKLRMVHENFYGELPHYWTRRITDTVPTFLFFHNMISQNLEGRPNTYSEDQIALKFSLINANKSAIEYFFNRLEISEYDVVITSYLHCLLNPYQYLIHPFVLPFRKKEHYNDAFYFLMSKFEFSRRACVLFSLRSDFLIKFLMYPFFGLMSTYGKTFVETLTVREIDMLLIKIIYMIIHNVHFFEYDLYAEFWDRVPEPFKITLRRGGLLRFALAALERHENAIQREN